MESANRTGPVHYRTAAVGGVNVFYREAGPDSGPVVLLLHGFPSSSRMFRDLIPRLSDAYHLIAPDYPAFGHSAVPGPVRVRIHLRPPGRRGRRPARAARNR
jgi:pimeloyl-ACP methyl ester carboxylesterase